MAQRFFVVRELGIGLALVLLIAVTAMVNPRFLSAQSIKDLLLGSTILAILATGQAIVVITRNVDLSVGSVLGLSAFATGTLFVDAPGTPIPVAVAARAWRWARRAGAVNGVLDRGGPGAGAGGDARHAVRLPRHRLHVGHRPADQRRRHAVRVPADGHERGARRPRAGAVRRRGAGGRRVLPALVPQRPRVVRDRLGAGGRAAVRHSGRAAGLRRVRASAARSPGSPACCYAARFGTHRRQRRHRLRNSTWWRPSWSAAWPSSAAAARCTVRRSARCC